MICDLEFGHVMAALNLDIQYMGMWALSGITRAQLQVSLIANR